MSSSDYRFFKTSNSSYPILVSKGGKGMYFTLGGQTYSDIGSRMHSIEYYERKGRRDEFSEISLTDALYALNTNGKVLFLDRLKIVAPDFKLSDEDKNKIINILRDARAFNEDSALALKDSNCFILIQKKLIKEYKGRYFINNAPVESDSPQLILDIG